MSVTREELIDECATLRVEVVELREELERVTRERDRYKECYEDSCYTYDELTIPMETV